MINGISSGISVNKLERDFWSGEKITDEVAQQDITKLGIKSETLSQNKDLDYYDAVDGMEFNDGTIMSRDKFDISLNDDATANARYLGYENGKYKVNFDISDYEITPDNIRATMIHEAYGHGVKGFSDGLRNHYKAYFATVDSRYWVNTTLQFKKFTVKTMWQYFYNEVGYKPMPLKYYNEYIKYSN